MLRSRKGFTLVELLVSLGIIAVLLSILLPVLAHVRRTARTTACLANLQQWGQSFQLYLAASRGRPPLSPADVTSLHWYEALQPDNGDVHRTLLCPEATEAGNVVGSASQAWGPNRTYNVGNPQWVVRGTFVGSYGFNGWLYQLPADQAAQFGPGPIPFPGKQPDRVPVLADCIEQLAYPEDKDQAPANLRRPIPVAGSGEFGPAGMMSRFCIDRHRMAVNVVFLDAHAATTPLPDLWKLRWNHHFTPQDVAVPHP